MRVTAKRLTEVIHSNARISVVKAASEQRYVLGVGYWAGPRKQIGTGADGGRDFISATVLEKAAWNFIRKGGRVGLYHLDGTDQCGYADVVESYIWRGDPWRIVDTSGRSQIVKAGDWLVGMILSPQAWELYKAGELGGFSPQGRGRRRLPATPPN